MKGSPNTVPPLADVLADLRVRLTRAIDALADAEIDYARELLEDALLDCQEAAR